MKYREEIQNVLDELRGSYEFPDDKAFGDAVREKAAGAKRDETHPANVKRLHTATVPSGKHSAIPAIIASAAAFAVLIGIGCFFGYLAANDIPLLGEKTTGTDRAPVDAQSSPRTAESAVPPDASDLTVPEPTGTSSLVSFGTEPVSEPSDDAVDTASPTSDTEPTASITDDTTIPVSDDTAAPVEDTSDVPTDEQLKALVEQGAEACGLKVTVSDLTRASLHLHYTRDASVKYADKLSYDISNRYTIEVLGANGEWETYDPETLESWEDGTHWFDSLLGLGGEDYGTEENEYVIFYGDNMYETEIPNGHYRIKKYMSVTSEVTFERLGGLNAYAEFDITDKTQNLFDIAVGLENVTSEGAVLVVRQDGHNYFHNKVKLGYYTSFSVERKTGNGTWEPVKHVPTDVYSAVEPLKWNGVTRIQINWEQVYGSLPDGTYRIAKQFVNYAGTGSSRDDIINRSLYYSPEFVIGSSAASASPESDWGITLSVKDVTAEGLTLTISQRGGSCTGELEYGDEYAIERFSGGSWQPVKYLDDEVAWTDIANIVEPNTDKTVKLDWKWMYGTLPAGKYRVAKEFTDFRKTADYDTKTYYTEFTISEDAVSKLGIALRAAQYNARKMALQIVQNGGTAEGTILTDPGRYIIERNIDGEWYSYYAPPKDVPASDIGTLKVKRSGTTEIKLDWREAAGSLPVHEYRLGLTFTCGDITETRWLEFTVEESMTNEFGLSMRVISAASSGAKLGVYSKGADEQGFANFRNEFGLQKLTKSGKWEDLSVPKDAEWPKYPINKIYMATSGNAGMSLNVDWSGIFGELENGHYRISKIFYTGEGSSYKELTLYAEFDIN